MQDNPGGFNYISSFKRRENQEMGFKRGGFDRRTRTRLEASRTDTLRWGRFKQVLKTLIVPIPLQQIENWPEDMQLLLLKREKESSERYKFMKFLLGNGVPARNAMQLATAETYLRRMGVNVWIGIRDLPQEIVDDYNGIIAKGANGRLWEDELGYYSVRYHEWRRRPE